MKNISDIGNCYGCGLCATICARNVIEIKLNSDGFYEPKIIDNARCTDCGLCSDVCSYKSPGLASCGEIMRSYAAWSNDVQVRRKCSSGGVAFELGRYLIEQGYKVCGVRYNPDEERAEHYIATSIEELIASIGSKYIQSHTVNAFKSIDRKQKYLVTGSPCQIDSFRRYIQKFHCEDNFILMDFFCHGVPSMLVWKKYCKYIEKRIGKITYASWRNKFGFGWHDSWIMGIDGEKTSKPIDWHDSYDLQIREVKTFIQSRHTKGDMFYALFLSNSCLGKQCYEKCKFKYKSSSADIRIGDLWGKTYAHDSKGVNGVVAFTSKGDEVLHRCNLTLIEHPFEIVAEGQLKHCPTAPQYSEKVWDSLKSNNDIRDAAKYPLRIRNIMLWKGRINHLFRIFHIKYQLQ